MPIILALGRGGLPQKKKKEKKMFITSGKEVKSSQVSEVLLNVNKEFQLGRVVLTYNHSTWKIKAIGSLQS